MSLKKCSNCGVEAETTLCFRRRKYKNGKEFFNSQCKKCESSKTIAYNNVNVEKRKKYQKQWLEAHPNYKHEYNSKNITRIREYRRNYEKTPEIKIKRNISHHIRRILKQNKTSKNGLSVLSFLPYEIDALKEHLELQFESWMTWGNWGIYSKKWDDSDESTWTWQIDHILPQSHFPYTNMEDDNFKKCWALENLRPLSAKQNLLDGNRR